MTFWDWELLTTRHPLQWLLEEVCHGIFLRWRLLPSVHRLPGGFVWRLPRGLPGSSGRLCSNVRQELSPVVRKSEENANEGWSEANN